MAQWNQGLPTLQQSLPGLQGARSGQDLMRAYLQNQQQQQQNADQPGFNQAKLAQMLAQTQGQNTKNEQMPERLGLDEYKAYVMAQNASHGMKNIELQYQKLGALRANALSRVSNAMPGMISQGGDPNVAAGALAAAGGFAKEVGQSYSAPQSGAGRPQSAELPPPNFPALQQYLGQSQQRGALQPPQGMPQGQPAQPQMQQQGIPDQMTEDLQDSQRSAAIKKTSTAQIINQRHYSDLLDDLITRTTPNMTTAIKAYSGTAGTARLKKDQIASLSGGKVTPELEAFNRVKNVATRFLANEVTRSLGEAHNLATADEMRNLANPIYWGTNPKLALAQWDEFVKNSKQVSRTLSKSTAQTRDSLRGIGDEPPQPSSSLSSLSSPSAQQEISSAPPGTVEMVDEQGNSYAIPHSDVNAAIQHGWRHSNG